MAVDPKTKQQIVDIVDELGGHENAMLYGICLLTASLSRIADAIEPVAHAVIAAMHDDGEEEPDEANAAADPAADGFV
jgi:hypothetical protein